MELHRLAWLTFVLVVFMGISSVGMLWRPAQVRALLLRFPRDRWSGRVLSAGAVFWAAWLLYHMPLGRFENMKPLVWPAAAALAAGIWFWMDELLAPRALGALLLLYPAPVLEAARLHPSSWSVVMSVMAYVCIVKGMALLLSPFWFRMGVTRFWGSDVRCRIWGGAAAVISIFLLVLALRVFK